MDHVAYWNIGTAIDRSAYGNMDDWLPVGELAHTRRDGQEGGQ